MKTKNLKITVLLVLLAAVCMTVVVGCGNNDSEQTSYKLTYTAVFGGYIVGSNEQEVGEGADGETVVAVANEGFRFTGWSDGSTEAERYDEYLRDDFSMTAYFEPTEKTFRYDYRGATLGADARTVTVRRDDPKASVFAVPQREGYDFIGWYADENFTTRVTDEDGGLMYGYNTVTLETDTLYARWSDPDDDTTVFKILIVVVDEIDATFKLIADKTQTKRVHHKITMPERILCKQIAGRISAYLNEWFAGKVRFEIDTFFTTQAVDEESFDNNSRMINAFHIKEIKHISEKYDSILSFFDLNDYDYEFKEHGVRGVGGFAQGSIYLETFMEYVFANKRIADKVMNGDQSVEGRWTGSIIETGIHEFVHTVDCRYVMGELYEFDYAIRDLWQDGIQDFIEISRRYLLCEAEVDGEIVGIPPRFWSEQLWKENKYLKKED